MRLDGRAIAAQIRQDLKKEIARLAKKGVRPHLAVVLVGDNPNSLIYISQKRIQAEKVGCHFSLHQFSETTPYNEVVSKIKQLATDPKVHGLIVQRPIPPPFTNNLTSLVPPAKDVDGFLPNSLFDPPVALAVLKCLETIYLSNEMGENPKKFFRVGAKFNDFLVWLHTKQIVIVGRGETAGKPIAQTLNNYNIPFSAIHSQTINRIQLLKNADVVISAVGKSDTVRASDLKKGVLIIGIGLHVENGKLVGDYNEEEIEVQAAVYTPTPGGTGPVNVASLIENTVKSANSIIFNR